jgi:hypothetical protein
LFVIAAADWVSGTYVMTTIWQRRRPRRRQPASTPLADEVEAWLRQRA